MTKYEIFTYILSISNPFAIKLGLIIQHHRPECPVKKLETKQVFQQLQKERTDWVLDDNFFRSS